MTRTTVGTYILFFLLVSINIIGYSQDDNSTYVLDKTTRFDKFRVQDGLATDLTGSIHQDKYGFIWISASYGLSLYDGYNVKTFTADPKNPQTILGGNIVNIFEEPDGTLWLSKRYGISRYNRANQTFSNYLQDTLYSHNYNYTTQKILPDGDHLWVDGWYNLFRFDKRSETFKSFGKDSLNPEKGIKHLRSNYIFIDRSGVLWVCSSNDQGSYALSRFNKETETFTHFENDPSNAESFAGKEVKSMIEDRDGTLWIATIGGGLLEVIDKENGKFRQYFDTDADTDFAMNKNLQTVFEDSNGNIWLGGNNGFSLFDKKDGSFKNYPVPMRTDNPNWVNFIQDIIEDENGNLYLDSADGFFIFNPITQQLLHYKNDPENKNSLNSNNIYRIIIDHTGMPWVVFKGRGVNTVNPFSNAFRRVQKESHVTGSLSDNTVSDIFVDSKDNLWIGNHTGEGGGLNKTTMNPQRDFKDFEHFVFDANDPKSIASSWIYFIYEDRGETIWVGGAKGLNRYDPVTKSFTRFQHDPDDSTTLNSNSMHSILEDSHGTFWVGTKNGLNMMNKETGKCIRFLPDINDRNSTYGKGVYKILEDSRGELWIAGAKHISRFIREDSSFVSYSTNDLYPGFNPSDHIREMEEDDSANLWLATTAGGLIKFERNSMTFKAITTAQGLLVDNLKSLEIDDRGFIWVSSTQGLSRIDPLDYSIRNYDAADGLIPGEFVEQSSFKDKDGWLYFGGREGITFFHPDSLKDNTHIPPVYITSLTVAGLPKYFDKPLFEMENIELQYNENDFSFDFAALNYINPQKNQYAYMLEGYDEDWIYVENQRTANYTNLNPGTYTFKVKGSNNDGYWNEEGASLAITIYPPFWKTWWAYIIYVITFFGLLFLVRRNEIKKINLRQELEIKQVHTDQLEELDIEKNKFFSNISHEFRTPLTLILGPLEKLIIGNKNEKEKDQLNLVRRNARRLQTLINQLLSLSKIESGKMKLRARSENIVKMASLFLQSFHSMAEDKGIKLEFESDAEEHIVCIDTLKFEKVVNNLLSNAFKFTERGGKIKVSIRNIQSSVFKPTRMDPQTDNNTTPTSDRIQIIFSDTGIGIQKEDLPHVFDRFYQVDEQQMKTNLGTGIGLSLTKELIELHHGTITVDSEAGMGTTFTIFLPTGKDHLSEDEIIETTNGASEMDDELLNDDYLFVQDNISKTEVKTEINDNGDLPLLLIVEDNEDMRAYIKSYLVDSYQILEAPNGSDGAKIAIEQLPDLIVSDLMMPIMDGNEMTQQLKNDERTSHIPIILLTAKSSTASKLEGLETGADDFLTKPFDAEELLIRIKNLIEGRRKLRALLSQHIGDVAQTRIIKDSSGKAMSKLDEQFLEKAKNLIDEHMANPDFSVEMLAQEMAMSRVQLHRKLKSLTDNSASDLMRNLRLKRAAELLKEGELNVTQVSYEVGISSLSYFAKAFKEQYGVTPSEYS